MEKPSIEELRAYAQIGIGGVLLLLFAIMALRNNHGFTLEELFQALMSLGWLFNGAALVKRQR